MKEIRIMVRIEGSGQSLQRFFKQLQVSLDLKNALVIVVEQQVE